jgi:hypothetical protein
MERRLRCILGLHKWRTVRNEDGEPYRACELCPAEADAISIGGNPGNAGGSSFL